MKSVSIETREKIDRLFHGGSFWSRVLASSEEQVELLHEIGFSGEAGAIPEIACLLVDASGPVFRTAVEAVHRLLQTLAPFDLVGLDQRIRMISGSDRGLDHGWRKLRPTGLRRFDSSEFAASLFGLASFHNDGYVREAAVNSLSALQDGQELPFLLIRLNDWVSPVRDAAARAVSARLLPEYAAHFLRNLRLVLRLQACGRTNRALVDLVCVLLRKPECREALQSGIKSGDRSLRRASFQLAAGAEQSVRAVIVKAALTDTDSVARAWAVRRFLPEVAANELPSVAIPMLTDRFMPVRRDALWALATKCPDLAVEPLKHAMLDRHVGMREVARHFLSADSMFDVRRFYLEALEVGESAPLGASIRGLGETGKAEDAALVLPFLGAPKPSIRRAAVYAVGKLNAEPFGEQLIKLLADEMPGVSREALKALTPKAKHQSLGKLWKLFASEQMVFVRRNAFILILFFGKWQKLPPILLACADKDVRLSGLAQNALRDWLRNYNRSFAEPTRADFEKIEAALAQTETKLPDRAAQEIRACLKDYFP
jgi:HEAT repeat protein